VLNERGITFRTSLPDESVWADADMTRITQVIGNLLHNAAKFTRRGDEVALSLRAAGDHAEIAVRDTGAGIDPALLPLVFDPFVQGERTLARTEGGLGLGLALVKGITELHGGTVRADSEGKKGCAVRRPAADRPIRMRPGDVRSRHERVPREMVYSLLADAMAVRHEDGDVIALACSCHLDTLNSRRTAFTLRHLASRPPGGTRPSCGGATIRLDVRLGSCAAFARGGRSRSSQKTERCPSSTTSTVTTRHSSGRSTTRRPLTSVERARCRGGRSRTHMACVRQRVTSRMECRACGHATPLTWERRSERPGLLAEAPPPQGVRFELLHTGTRARVQHEEASQHIRRCVTISRREHAWRDVRLGSTGALRRRSLAAAPRRWAE
jgi:anti-sigma regulatory factor (Ser/Thr protein kinase)